MAWTTDDLVSQFRLEAWLPDADDLSSASILALGDAELQSGVFARLKVAREEHGITTQDVAISSSRIRLPRRCLARAIRTLTLVSSDGSQQPFSLIDAGDAWRYASAQSAVPCIGYLEDDEVVLPAPPQSGYSLRFRFVRRPSRLVTVASCAAIQAPTSTTTMKVISPPATITTVAALFDIVRGDEPFPVIAEDRKTSAYGAPDLTLDASTPIVVADISAAGNPPPPGTRVDYVCPRDTTCYPPVPTVLFGVLCAAMVLAYARQGTNRELQASARERLDERIADAKRLMEPRTTDRPAFVRLDSPLRLGRFASSSRRGPWR